MNFFVFKKISIALFFAVVLASIAGTAYARQRAVESETICTDVVTPHIPWATPLLGGPVELLFVAPRFALRDLAEVAQRMEVRYESVGVWDAQHLGYDVSLAEQHLAGYAPEEVAAQLRAQLKRPGDVIVLAGFDLAQLPDALQELLLERVREGAGLVVTQAVQGADTRLRRVLDGLEELHIPLGRGVAPCVPESTTEPVQLRTGQYGKGRVAEISFAGDRAATHCLIAMPTDVMRIFPGYRENAYAQILRVLLWAAKRTAPCQITDVAYTGPTGPDEEEIPPGQTPEFVQAMRDSVVHQPMRPYTLALNRPAPKRYEVMLQLRQWDTERHLVYSSETRLAKGARLHPFELLVGPGNYLLDVWLMQRDRVVDWYSKPIVVEGWPEFEGVSFSKNYLLPNDVLDVTCTVRPVFGRNRSGTLYACAIDSLPCATTADGRLLAETHVAFDHKGGRFTLRLPFSDLIAPLVKVELFTAEGEPNSMNTLEMCRSFRRYHYMTVRLPHGENPTPQLFVSAPTTAEYNARGFLSALQEQGASFCSAEGSEANLFYTALGNMRLLPQIAQYTPEFIRDGFCRQPCLSDPAYLKREVKRLQETARTLWAGGSAWYSLGQDNALTLGDEHLCFSPSCQEAFIARLKNRYGALDKLNAAWESQVLDWSEIVPPPYLEKDTSINPAPYWDFRDHMAQTFTEFHQLARTAVRQLDPKAHVGFRAQATQNPARGYDWIGLGHSLDFLALDPNPALLAQLQYAPAPARSLMLTFGDHYHVDTEAQAQWLPWYAAVHQVSGVWLMNPFGDIRNAAPHAALLPDGRPQPWFDSFLESFNALQDGLGALLLQAERSPATLAIYTNTRSQQCTARELKFSLVETPLTRYVNALQGGGYSFDVLSPADLTATALNRYAVLLLPAVNSLGEGEAELLQYFAERGGVLLGEAPVGEMDEHGRSQVSPLNALLQEEPHHLWAANFSTTHFPQTLYDMLKKKGQHAATPLQFKHASFQGIQSCFRFGKAEIVALLAAPNASKQSCRLQWPKDTIAYDLRTGKEVVRPHKHRCTVLPGEALLFAKLPYEVDRIDIRLPESVSAGKRLQLSLTVAPEAGEAGTHLVCLQLSPKGGAPLRHYTRYVRCENGHGETYLPLAYNESPGDYEIHARDILSGVETTVGLRILFADR